MPGQEAHARDLERLAGELGLGDRVRFAGWRYGPADMPDVFRALSVLALPSKEPEPFGLVLLEAMACGVPVVATDHGGPSEICVAGETGLLVPPGDSGALAEALSSLLRDPARAEALGRAGRERWEREFGLDVFYEATQKVYDEAAAHLPS